MRHLRHIRLEMHLYSVLLMVSSRSVASSSSPIYLLTCTSLHSPSSRVATQTGSIGLPLSRTLLARSNILGWQTCRVWCQGNSSKCRWSKSCTQRSCWDRCHISRHRVGSKCRLVQLRSVDSDTDLLDSLLHWSHDYFDRVRVVALVPDVSNLKSEIQPCLFLPLAVLSTKVYDRMQKLTRTNLSHNSQNSR
jgi:hypothetical protein